MIGINSTPKTYKSYANGYKAIVDTSFKKGKDYRKDIFMMEDTSNYEDRVVEIGGVDAPSRWDDGDRASQTEIREGYEKRLTQVRYGKEIPIGWVMSKFQGKDIDITRRAMRVLGDQHYRMEQKAAYSLLNYGASDTNTFLSGINGSTVSALGPDGKRLFSVAHSCSPTNPTTWSNALADNASVGEAAADAMLQNLYDQLDDKGNKKYYGENGVIWLVPRNKAADAYRTIGHKDAPLRPDTGDNSINVFGKFNGFDVEVRVIPWLSDVSSTAHYMIAKGLTDTEMPLMVLTSEPFTTDDYMDESTKVAYVRTYEMFSVGFLSGRGLVRSEGTDTGTYTA